MKYAKSLQVKEVKSGGAVAQASAPTMDGPERPRGPGFESDSRSFPDPTPNLSPARILSLLTVLSN